MKRTVEEIPRRPLGRTGALVSALGLSGLELTLPPEKEAIRLVRRGIDCGITFLDCCRESSEERFGKALREGYRDRAFLMTRIDGRTAKSALRQLEQSLGRLQTDRIDLLQFHEVIRMSDPALIFAAGGALEAVVKAREQGKVRFIGFTGHKSPAIHQQMLDVATRHSFRFDAVQLPLSLTDGRFDSFEKRILPRLVREELGVLAMNAPHPHDSSRVSSGDCLRYAMSLPVSVTITGIDSLSSLEQALRIGRAFKPLTPDQRLAIVARTHTSTFAATERHLEWLG